MSRVGKKLIEVPSGVTLEALKDRIFDEGGEAYVIAADVADRSKMLLAAQEAASHFGRIDTWVNNAGVSIYGRLDEVSEEDSRRLFDTNFWGVVNGSLDRSPSSIHWAADGSGLYFTAESEGSVA